jgi:tetratricopeptide (TPR) repeat protein
MSDLARYLPRLEFNIRAQFEPVSGLMFLNVDFATFCRAGVNSLLGKATESDAELTSAINHEWYHYFQSISNGYQYAYTSEMWRAIVQWQQDRPRKPSGNPDDLEVIESPEVAEEKGNIQDPNFAKRMRGIQALAQKADRASQWEKNPTAGDLSVLAAEGPELAQAFDKLWAELTLRNADGLSAMDLIEGSAIVFEHTATQGRDGLEERLANVWQVHGDEYRKAYELAKAYCGPRVPEILQPTAALALRYANPAAAFPFFLERLNSSRPGSEIADARRLAEHPPGIESAGPYLGTARDVRESQRDLQDRFSIYDDVLDDLAKRGSDVDEIDLMADPSTLGKLSSFPVQMVANDVPLRGKLDVNELTWRLQLGNLVLRTRKLPRYRRDADQRLSDRLHAPMALLMNPQRGADEYAHLAFESSQIGDLEQAQLHYATALAIYESLGDKAGIANACFALGNLHSNRNDLDRAEEMYRKSLELSRGLEDQAGTARAAGNLGAVYQARRQFDQAELLIREALGIEERLGLKEATAIEYYNLGRISRERGDLVQGEGLLNKALRLYEDAGNSGMARAAKALLEAVHKARQ